MSQTSTGQTRMAGTGEVVSSLRPSEMRMDQVKARYVLGYAVYRMDSTFWSYATLQFVAGNVPLLM